MCCVQPDFKVSILVTTIPQLEAPLQLRWRNLKTNVSLWKRVKYFPSTPRRNFKRNNTETVILDLCWWKTRSGYHMIVVDAILFEKLRF